MPMNEGPLIECVFGQDNYLDFLCSATSGTNVRAVVMYAKFRVLEAADDAQLQIIRFFSRQGDLDEGWGLGLWMTWIIP